MKKTNQTHSLLPCFMLVLVTLFYGTYADKIADKDADSVALAVEKEVGSSNYPFDAEGEKGSKIMDVDTSTMESYFANTKVEGSGNNSEVYIMFVGKANSENAAKNAAKNLDSYIEAKEKSMNSYLSETGKTMFLNGKIGSGGKWCWAVVLKTESLNEKAVDVIKGQNQH